MSARDEPGCRPPGSARARTTHAAPRLRPWQPWTALAGFAFLLHFVWEILQVPFYAAMPGARHWDAIRTCTVATLGDVVLMLVSYGLLAAGTHERGWLRRPTPARLAGLIVVGLAVSLVVELLSTRMWDRWQYAAGAPVIAGMAVNVWLQWLLLPPLTIWLARRHLGLARSQSPSGPSNRGPTEEIAP